MIQIYQKNKEKVYEAIRTGKIDAAEMSFPNLIDDIILTMKRRGLTDSLAQSMPTLAPTEREIRMLQHFRFLEPDVQNFLELLIEHLNSGAKKQQ